MKISKINLFLYMYPLYLRGFKIDSQSEYNKFIKNTLQVGENYLKFLIQKNILYLPSHLTPHYTAVDLLAEIFTLQNNILIKFTEYFNKFDSNNQKMNEAEYEKRYRSFIYKIIQNNLHIIYKEIDPITYNSLRNIKGAVKNLGYFITQHFSDRYIQITVNVDLILPIADKSDIIEIVNRNSLKKLLSNTKLFLESLMKAFEKSGKFSAVVKMNELVSVMKSLFVYGYLENSDSEQENITGNLHLKFMLDEIRYSFIEKLTKYIQKNNLPKNFAEGMYNIIDEVIKDLNAGNGRASVRELVSSHFGKADKSLVNKVQYCMEMFEDEIAKRIKKENLLSD